MSTYIFFQNPSKNFHSPCCSLSWNLCCFPLPSFHKSQSSTCRNLHLFLHFLFITLPAHCPVYCVSKPCDFPRSPHPPSLIYLWLPTRASSSLCICLIWLPTRHPFSSCLSATLLPSIRTSKPSPHCLIVLPSLLVVFPVSHTTFLPWPSSPYPCSLSAHCFILSLSSRHPHLLSLLSFSFTCIANNKPLSIFFIYAISFLCTR